jgi:diguanylate cyclase (GGDEF)-like protein
VIETIVELRNGAVHEIHHEPMPGGGWVATFDDITERRRFQARIHHMAHHDALTGLPNRVLFAERLDEMVARFHDLGQTGALLCLDLDRFKEVNDGFGHAAGDELLRQVAARIQGQLSEDEMLARLGGDEFAIIAQNIHAPESATVLASSIANSFSEPFSLGPGVASVGVSIGIALCSADEEVTVESLLCSADRALYRSKTRLG